MARLPRLNPPGIPQHLIQRGNNRQVCFNGEQDFSAYLHWLDESAKKNQVAIHAYVLMDNHVHLLATPKTSDSISKMMQTLGRLYVRYFNREYRRSGTLWEGRYKSCLVQSENYLLECYRYIELNPVRAGMVNDPADYPWSSYRCNALGKSYRLIRPHAEYLALGKNKTDRLEHYRELFTAQVDQALLTEIRDSVMKNLVLGNERFKDEIEANLKRRVRPAKMGRPKNEAAEGQVDGSHSQESLL